MLKSRSIYIAILSVATLTTACHTSRQSYPTTVQPVGQGAESVKTVDKVKEQNRFDALTGEATGVTKVLLDEARGWIGTPYKYAGNGRDGVDCSGFTLAVYKNALNISLPRNSREQSVYCVPVEKNDLKPGDLLFFSGNRKEDDVSHVGLYVGDNTMIHASSSMGVILSDLNSPYYTRTFKSAGYVSSFRERAEGPVTMSSLRSGAERLHPESAPEVNKTDSVNVVIQTTQSATVEALRGSTTKTLPSTPGTPAASSAENKPKQSEPVKKDAPVTPAKAESPAKVTPAKQESLEQQTPKVIPVHAQSAPEVQSTSVEDSRSSVLSGLKEKDLNSTENED